MGNQIVSAIDLGSTKTVCLIASIDDNKKIEIVGHGVAESEGMSKGILVNLDRTIQSIEQAKNDAEKMAGVEIGNCYTGIAGRHIKSYNNKGVVAIQSADHEISQNDVSRVLEAAKRIVLPIEREIIHIIPQEFSIDEQEGFLNPIGLSGSRLEAKVHIVTGTKSMLQNIRKSLTKTGMKTEELILQQYASSFSILSEEEKNRGAVLLDIGGGTTDIALFYNGSVRYTSVLPIGGNNITNDIAIGVQCPLSVAEEIKKIYGKAIASKAPEKEKFVVRGVGRTKEKEVNANILASIIEPRVEEIFTFVNQELKRTEFADLIISGVVLTGGTAMLKDIDELAENIFGMSAKVGVPDGVSGITDKIMTPAYATSIGLLLYGFNNMQFDSSKVFSEDNIINSITDKIKNFFKDFI